MCGLFFVCLGFHLFVCLIYIYTHTYIYLFIFLLLLFLRDVYVCMAILGLGDGAGLRKAGSQLGAPFGTRNLSSVGKCLYFEAGCRSSATLTASIC